MALSAKERKQNQRDRELRLGRRGRLLFLTDEEFSKVKQFVELERDKTSIADLEFVPTRGLTMPAPEWADNAEFYVYNKGRIVFGPHKGSQGFQDCHSWQNYNCGLIYAKTDPTK